MGNQSQCWIRLSVQGLPFSALGGVRSLPKRWGWFSITRQRWRHVSHFISSRAFDTCSLYYGALLGRRAYSDRLGRNNLALIVIGRVCGTTSNRALFQKS